MAQICIACESSHVAAANSLADTLRSLSHDVRIITEDRYPVADAMTVFLGIMDRDFDAALILISDSPQASGWIIKELRIRHLYPKSFPVLLDGVADPDSWPDGVPLFHSADINENAVNDILGRSAPNGPPT